MNKLLLILFTAFISIYSQPTTATKDTLHLQLEQITISATRYPEKVLEIPYAVSIITPKDLENITGYGLNEVLSSVPGVLAQSRAGNQDIRITIRGFGARGSGDRSNSGTSRGIRVMIDGIPETEPDGRTSFDQVELSGAEQIEIIRSNASALWGNAAGGILNISSVPTYDFPYLSFKGISGSFGLKKYGFNFNTKLLNGKMFGSVYRTNFEGWREHSGSERTVFNLGFTSKLAPQTDLGVFLLATGDLFHVPGPLNQTQYENSASQSNPTYLSRDERRYNRLGRIGVTIDHGFNEMHEISAMAFVNPKYLQRSERGTFRDFTRYHTGGNILYKNHFLNDYLRNNLTAGIDEAYQDGAILFYSLSSTNGRGKELKDNKREGANTFGAFLQNETNIGDALSILLGIRYDDVNYISESFIDPTLGLQEKSFSHVTPKVGLTYMFSQTHSVYFNMGGGVEVPAGNETDPAGTYGQDTVYLINPLLEPIVSTTFELGTKQVFVLNNSPLTSISYDLAGYYINIKNDIIPYRGGRFYFTAGKTNRMGIEAGINADFIYGISLKGALTFSSNKYNDYIIDSAHYGNPGKIADYKNNKTAGVPDMFYNASITWSPEKLEGLFISLSVNSVGKYFVDDANLIQVPAYSILNATVGLSRPLILGNLFGISAFVSVNNIADSKYISSAFINPDVVNGLPVYIEPGLPRNITASVSVSF